jgi:hypothetical protein
VNASPPKPSHDTNRRTKPKRARKISKEVKKKEVKEENEEINPGAEKIGVPRRTAHCLNGSHHTGRSSVVEQRPFNPSQAFGSNLHQNAAQRKEPAFMRVIEMRSRHQNALWRKE